jgi:TonB family protein
MNLDLFHRWNGWLLPKLADHLWQSTLIGLTILVVVYLLHRQSARLRHVLLLLGMAKFLLPSALVVSSLEFLGLTISGLLSSTSATSVSYLHPSLWLQLGEQESLTRMTAPLNKWSGAYFALVVAWLMGCLFLTVIWVRRRRPVKTLLAGTPRVSVGREADSLRRVSGWMLLKKHVALAMPSGFTEPGVWGIRTPVLLLPQGMTKEMTDAELESVILHELIHVERRDNLIAALQRVLCHLLWFHPLMWILDRKLLLERERVCDELVLGMHIDSSVYGASIVKVTRFCLDGKLAGASCVTGPDLKRRLEMILKTTILARFTGWHWTLVGAAACSVLLFSIVAGYPPPSLFLTTTELKDATNAPMVRPRSTISFWPDDRHLEVGDKLKDAPEVSMNMENQPGCPLIIVNASMRWLEFSGEAEGTLFGVQFGFELTNTTNRRVKSFVVSPFFPALEKLPSEGRSFMVLRRTIEPLGKLDMPKESTGLRLTERPESLTIRIEGVDFEDGTTWRKAGKPGSNGTQSGLGPSRVRVGGAVQSANLISQVAPVYPPLAKQARLQGDVVLEAVISREGDVTNLRVVSGHPLLVDAALTAARQWKYRPTLLNGQPVEVVSEVTVPFKLEP